MISFTLVVAVGVRVAFSKVARRPRNREINMPRWDSRQDASDSAHHLTSLPPPPPSRATDILNVSPPRPSAVSDHWWISCVTSRVPDSRERGTTPQCWLVPHRTDACPKTSTPRYCRARTTAVSLQRKKMWWGKWNLLKYSK